MASIEARKTTKGTSYKVIWYDSHGKKRSKTWGDKTRAELWKNLIEAVNGDTEAAVQALARQSSTAKTVDQVAKHRRGLIRATPYTLQTYDSYMRNHISPAFGSWPIDTVTEDDCRRFIISMEKKGLSPKYIRNVAGWLTSVLSHAEDRGWREGNPLNPEMLPRVTRTDADEEDMFLTREEAFAIIQRMEDPYGLPALLMLSTGMRPSEMRALKISDVYLDVSQPVVRVTKAIKQRIGEGEYVGAPKSGSGVRSLGLPASMVPIMRAHIGDRAPGEYLFPGDRKAWMSSSAFSQSFQRAAKRARADKVLTKSPSPYALRHSHASMMIDNGMDIYKLSRHLGHASVQMTERVYLHLYPDAVYRAAEIASVALGELPALTSTPLLCGTRLRDD